MREFLEYLSDTFLEHKFVLIFATVGSILLVSYYFAPAPPQPTINITKKMQRFDITAPFKGAMFVLGPEYLNQQRTLMNQIWDETAII